MLLRKNCFQVILRQLCCEVGYFNNYCKRLKSNFALFLR